MFGTRCIILEDFIAWEKLACWQVVVFIACTCYGTALMSHSFHIVPAFFYSILCIVYQTVDFPDKYAIPSQKNSKILWEVAKSRSQASTPLVRQPDIKTTFISGPRSVYPGYTRVSFEILAVSVCWPIASCTVCSLFRATSIRFCSSRRASVALVLSEMQRNTSQCTHILVKRMWHQNAVTLYVHHVPEQSRNV